MGVTITASTTASAQWEIFLRRFIKVSLATVCSVFGTSCQGGGATHVPDLTVQGGSTLRDVGKSRDTVVIAIYNPAECLDCAGMVPKWSAWERGATATRKFAVALVREPVAEERRHFALQRIVPMVLNHPPRSLRPPRVYLFVEGQVVDSGVSQAGEQAFLRWVSSGHVDSVRKD